MNTIQTPKLNPKWCDRCNSSDKVLYASKMNRLIRNEEDLSTYRYINTFIDTWEILPIYTIFRSDIQGTLSFD